MPKFGVVLGTFVFWPAARPKQSSRALGRSQLNKIPMQALLSEGMFIEKPRLAVCERALKVSRKRRYAGRMLKKISVPMIRGCCGRKFMFRLVPSKPESFAGRITTQWSESCMASSASGSIEIYQEDFFLKLYPIRLVHRL